MKPKTKTRHSSPAIAKCPTGIQGFDQITGGGLPRGRTTLIEGGPGSGKTIFGLQTLVNGARLHNESGIFVAFEETSRLIIANARTFGWDLPALLRNKLFFLDAHPASDVFVSGGFDLGGVLAGLDVKVREMKVRRLVCDSLDVVLALLCDPVAEQREMYRLHEWLLERELTALITCKAGGAVGPGAALPQLNFMQYTADCAVVLHQDVVEGVSHRSLRVVKYRGSGIAENEAPLLIGAGGLEVAGAAAINRTAITTTMERVSSGVARLDTMLGGGYFRGASVLLTGVPGTAKSTLAGAFAEAACRRGERALFIGFDTDANETVRNLASVNIRLERFRKKGLLCLVSARAISGSAEIHLMQIMRLAREHRARCVVIDPVSALAKSGNQGTAYGVVERLIDWTKTAGITLVCTSLLDDAGAQAEGTPLQISTVADTWLHLNYLVHAGERNRGLTIVKARGSAHSNQVRELVLSDQGITLADIFTAGGEVLMGTLRWEKERESEAARVVNEAASKLRQATLASEEAELEARLKALQHALAAKRTEKRVFAQKERDLATIATSGRSQMNFLRRGDEP
jgi:circadian clock protein KaiC